MQVNKGQFESICEMFPALDKELILDIYEGHRQDLEATIESLINLDANTRSALPN